MSTLTLPVRARLMTLLHNAWTAELSLEKLLYDDDTADQSEFPCAVSASQAYFAAMYSARASLLALQPTVQVISEAEIERRMAQLAQKGLYGPTNANLYGPLCRLRLASAIHNVPVPRHRLLTILRALNQMMMQHESHIIRHIGLSYRPILRHRPLGTQGPMLRFRHINLNHLHL